MDLASPTSLARLRFFTRFATGDLNNLSRSRAVRHGFCILVLRSPRLFLFASRSIARQTCTKSTLNRPSKTLYWYSARACTTGALAVILYRCSSQFVEATVTCAKPQYLRSASQASLALLEGYWTVAESITFMTRVLPPQ